ncbi:MAG: Lrp/AsnC family transcriptional regulator [Gammaproteobacteria bacterium]|nr:Lrp/AsnC family transcriptional regulator [Gammaproteobacteria bacterium]
MNSQIDLDAITDADRRVLEAIQGGLPLVPHPYAEIGLSIQMNEEEVIERIRTLQQSGVIRRMGIIVHHRPLGYQANAMVVWNLPEEQIEAFGNAVSPLDFVTLCYQRRADLPRWPYTLYTMIHGKDRESVLQRVESLVELSPLKQQTDYKVLFSSRRFKQQGARYFNQQRTTTTQGDSATQHHPTP